MLKLIIDMNTVFLFYTVCPGSSTPFYIVIYYKKWVTTSWTYSRESIHLLYTKCCPPPLPDRTRINI